MSDIILPAPIWTPDYSKLGENLRVPKWARPWEKTKEDALTAAVAVDSTSGLLTNYTTSSDPPVQTPSFTNTAGGLVVFVVGMGVASGGTTALSAVSYGANAMTMHTERAVTSGGTDSRVQIWYLLGAPTGANLFSYDPTMTSGVGFDVWAGAISFTGHNTTTPLTSNIGLASGSTGTSMSVTTPSAVAVGNYFLGAIGGGDGTWGTFTPAAWFTKTGSGTQLGMGKAGVTTGTGATMTVSGTQSTSDHWVAIGIEIAAASAGASGKRSTVQVVSQAVHRAMSR